jgi:hypothetical protein
MTIRFCALTLIIALFSAATIRPQMVIAQNVPASCDIRNYQNLVVGVYYNDNRAVAHLSIYVMRNSQVIFSNQGNATAGDLLDIPLTTAQNATDIYFYRRDTGEANRASSTLIGRALEERAGTVDDRPYCPGFAYMLIDNPDAWVPWNPPSD